MASGQASTSRRKAPRWTGSEGFFVSGQNLKKRTRWLAGLEYWLRGYELVALDFERSAGHADCRDVVSDSALDHYFFSAVLLIEAHAQRLVSDNYFLRRIALKFELCFNCPASCSDINVLQNAVDFNVGVYSRRTVLDIYVVREPGSCQN